jgi:hypothetical protein
MSQITLAIAMQTARDNLKVMGQEALVNSVGTYDYITVKPNAYPLIEFVVGQGQRTKISGTQQQFAIGIRMVITCAEFLQGFEGQAQDVAQFDYLPTVLQYFEVHGNLKTATLPRPAYLDAINSGVTGFQATALNNKIVLILNWNLIFITNFERC